MKKLLVVLVGFSVAALRAELPHELQSLLDANKSAESRAEQQIWLAKYLLTTGAGPLALEALVKVHEQKKNIQAQIEAQIMLGRIYLEGVAGVAANIAKAQQYLTLANAQKKLREDQKKLVQSLLQSLEVKKSTPGKEQFRQNVEKALEQHKKRISGVPAGANGAGEPAQ